MVETRSVNVASVNPAALAKTVERLTQILHACVHEGASIGFVVPFDPSEARDIRQTRLAGDGPTIAQAGA